jgi:hypothetical protein
MNYYGIPQLQWKTVFRPVNMIAIPFPRDIHILPKIGIYPSQLYAFTHLNYKLGSINILFHPKLF